MSRPGVQVTPWDVALRMMRNGRDPGLISAYLTEEAARAGVDPFALSMHPADVLSRHMTVVFSAAMKSLAAPIVTAARQIEKLCAAVSGGACHADVPLEIAVGGGR